MGTYGSYSGSINIPDNKKQEFTESIFKLLNYGGMVQFEEVNIYGLKIALIKPVEVNLDGEASFHYNYFEDDGWETVKYYADKGIFFSGKIGGDEFCNVITAVYFLYELYDESVGFTEIDGEVINAREYIGWINHILGTKYSMKKRFRLWDNIEAFCMDRTENECNNAGALQYALDFIPEELYWAAGGVELSDICYLSEGTESLCREEIAHGSYPEAVFECKQALIRYFENNSNAGAFDRICELVKKERVIREKMQNTELGEIAHMSLSLSARVIVYLSAELKKMDFWKIWKVLKADIYKDEIRPGYASEQLEEQRKDAIEAPIQPVRTSDFLHIDDYFTFYSIHDEELKDKPMYYISDDDRAFWWGQTEEVILSDDMDKWLKELSVIHKMIMEKISDETEDFSAYLKSFMEVLAEADKYYKRIFCFQCMFYEFIQSGWSREYVAAVRLFKKLVDENKGEGKIIEKAGYNWDITSRKVTHNIARLRLKRYLAVMANRELRKKYFGF